MSEFTININPPHNRHIGSPPKIGIRPTIDGRRQGVRESLEEQTMNMARSVAAFPQRQSASCRWSACRMRHCR